MGAADKQIRVSSPVKHELDRRRREDESFNDVIERLLEDDRDLLAGAGFWSDEEADRVREGKTRAKENSKEQMRRLSEEAS